MLGLYPHVAYDALLRRVAEGAGVVVVAPPYELQLEHDEISQSNGERFEQVRLRREWGGVEWRWEIGQIHEHIIGAAY